MTSFKFPIPPAMHPCTEQFTIILLALKFSNVKLYKFVYSDILSEYVSLENCVNILYYIDHYVWIILN